VWNFKSQYLTGRVSITAGKVYIQQLLIKNRTRLEVIIKTLPKYQ